MSHSSLSRCFDDQPGVTLNLPDGSRATVLLHGAQLVSWQTADGLEQLYCSPDSRFGPGTAVRGGVPVIFPQFEQLGPGLGLPRHGFARQRAWQLQEERRHDDHALAVLTLTDDADTRAVWPHGFELELTVSLTPGRLDLELHVANSGTTAWPFSAALHTYLATADVERVKLQGLQGLTFLDRLTDIDDEEAQGERGISGETDLIFRQVKQGLLLRDGARRLHIDQEGFQDVVLWNPGPAKAAALPDLPDADWRAFVCVEAAQIHRPPMLAPQESWTGRQTLRLAEPSPAESGTD